jgi:predicted dehydrogenase
LLRTRLNSTDRFVGDSLLDIAIGHQLDDILYALGPFASLSSTATTHYLNVKLLDANGNVTGEATSTIKDHIAISGILKSGALISIQWRTGGSSANRRQFLWEIDGEDGVLRVENNACESHC